MLSDSLVQYVNLLHLFELVIAHM